MMSIFPCQLAHHVADPLTHGADARPSRWIGHTGVHGDLAAVTGFAGDRDDLDGLVRDFGDFELEQFAHEVRMGPRQGDLRSRAPRATPTT